MQQYQGVLEENEAQRMQIPAASDGAQQKPTVSDFKAAPTSPITFKMDTSDELNQMTAWSETSNERHIKDLDPVQAWFESAVEEKEPQPTTPCSLGL
eukprot:4031880-Lingulodinium_polyedra.AAC.1